MSRFVHMVVLVLALVGQGAYAQESVSVPRRTAEERAMKQTEMLIRDLKIDNPELMDTIYRVHLRYARKREQATTRMETLDCINSLLAELKGILTAEQYERLQSMPLRQGARAPHAGTDSAFQSATRPTR